jgi:hypothetical protein
MFGLVLVALGGAGCEARPVPAPEAGPRDAAAAGDAPPRDARPADASPSGGAPAAGTRDCPEDPPAGEPAVRVVAGACETAWLVRTSGVLFALGDGDHDGLREVGIGVGEDRYGLLTVRDGRTGRPEACFAAPWMRRACVAAGDADGDGRDEIACEVQLPSDAGDVPVPMVVDLYSPGRGGRLWRFAPPADLDASGVRSVRPIADVDGDGRADLAVGIPGTGVKPRPGAVVVVSGRDGAVVEAVRGDAGFGGGTAWPGDLDADGRADLAVVTHTERGQQVEAWSPATRRRLWVDDLSFESVVLEAVGDLDGDGVGDLGLGLPLHFGPAPDHVLEAGVVQILSGRTGGVVWRVDGVRADETLGAVLRAAPDLDGDGVPEVVASAPMGAGPLDETDGRVLILGGRDGRVLVELHGLGAPTNEFADQFGAAVEVLGTPGPGRVRLAVTTQVAGPAPGAFYPYVLVLDCGGSAP